MLIGYCRVSTETQKLDRQLDQLTENGVDPRNIYREKASGTNRNRPELIRMLSELRPGDVVMVCDITRLSRSTKDLLEIIEKITNKGCAVKSLKDTWLDTSSQSAYGAFLLTVMASLSQLERDLTSQRVREGLAAAKARGRSPGRPSKVKELNEAVTTMAAGGMRVCDIVEITGASRSTVQRILRQTRVS